MMFSTPSSISFVLLSCLQGAVCVPVGPQADAATVTASTVSATGTSFPSPATPVGQCRDPYPSTKGRLFQIQSKTQYFAGSNAWWLGHLQANSDVDNTFTQLASTQLKVVRTWAFGNTNNPANTYGVYFQILNSTGQYFNFDPSTGIPRLDYVVSSAEKKGVKLIMTLLNYYDDLGGMPTYANALGCTGNAFYTDAKCTAAYKAYIKFIVNRYKFSTGIFSWELCNEPRCPGCSASVITNWASSISAYIKSLDPNHLVSIGDEGWLEPPLGDGSIGYNGYEGVDFATNLAIKTIDYGTFHSYPEYWGYNNTWPNTWIVQHDAIGKKLGKPVILEEYGSSVPSDGKQAIVSPWQTTILQSTSLAADFTWQFGTSLTSANPFDGYAIYYNTTAGSDYDVLVRQHAAKMLAKQPVPIT